MILIWRVLFATASSLSVGIKVRIRWKDAVKHVALCPLCGVSLKDTIPGS
jgi:hypothetical protein